MTHLRRFSCDDLFHYNNVNLDNFTETFNLPFYLHYASRWPDFFNVAISADQQIMGYVMGKAEGNGTNWHGHVTAVTVAPEFRRLGLAQTLMDWLEEVSEKVYNGYFVDLFVRKSNHVAIEMYEKFGYTVYRRVLDYYSGTEDALDMRKALCRDVEKKSVIPMTRAITPDELEDD